MSDNLPELPSKPQSTTYSRRKVLGMGVGSSVGLLGVGTLSAVLTACGVTPHAVSKGTRNVFASGNAIPMAELIAGAKKEGRLDLIALPPDWANYGNIISTFQKKYGITVSSQAPDDSSAQELEAITTYKNSSSLAPDAVDVGPPFAAQGVAEHMWAPYRNSHWDTIPDTLKNAQGYWCGDYYGVVAFGSNRAVVHNPPKDWADLMKPEYRNMVSIDGDPRTAQDAFMAVWAAALANGGSLDNIAPGIAFFAELKKRGNFIPVDNYPANISKGTTPIAIKWDYLLLSYRKDWQGNPPLTVSIPSSGVIGGYYCQAINRDSYHPYAARLWEEFLYSDEGQILYLEGFAHPARFLNLSQNGKIPAALTAQLPPASEYAKAQFPSVVQTTKAAAVLQAQWGPKIVGS